jgi:hypothetical protein
MMLGVVRKLFEVTTFKCPIATSIGAVFHQVANDCEAVARLPR